MKLLRIITLFSIFLLAQILYADNQPDQSSQPQTLEELKVAIEKICKDTNTPTIGIALVNKDGPYWMEALGEANIEKHIKADENTMFPIPSISKMFVSLSVLKLVEAGKLRLDDELHDIAPDVKFYNEWEKTNPGRLVHLLENTTGGDDFHLAEINLRNQILLASRAL